MRSWNCSCLLVMCLAMVFWLSPSVAAQPDDVTERFDGHAFRWERIPAPAPAASLLDLGHHYRVRLAEEGKATEVQLPVKAQAIGAMDLSTLRWGRLDPGTKQYEVLDVPVVVSGKGTSVRLAQSGDYSLFGLPAEPLGKAAIGRVCAIEGRPTPAQIEPICTKIYCAGFKEVGPIGVSGDPGIPGMPPRPGPGGGDICERCMNRGGRLPEAIAECHLTKGIDVGIVLPPLFPLPVCQVSPASMVDPSEPGNYPVASTEYKFVDAINIPPNDPNTDVWATVRYPGAAAGPDAAIAPGTTKFPLVLYLHGNHGTVISGSSHVCGGSGPPVPNHDGYNYVLDRLASLGFIAVSINANDLNCKADRIPERGKLILEHLRRWKNWNDPGQPDADFGGRFYNRVDLNRIGLAGHSRGGEAVLSAYLENKNAGLGFGIKALHSIAPVDFHGLILEDVPYYVLLPAADGDVSSLAGARLYDRAAPRANPNKMPKMQSHVYGANHNWFNTVWFQDEGSPPGGTAGRLTQPQQQAVERVMAVAFFRQFLQGFTSARGLFTGTAAVASLAPAEIYRSYQDPVHLNVDDFEDLPANVALNSLGGSNAGVSLSPFGEFSFTQGSAFNPSFFQQTKGLIAGWNAAGDQFTLAIPASKKDVSAYRYLSFRITQVFDNGAVNPVGQDQDLDVGLEDELGNKIFLRVGTYDRIPFPYQRPSLIKSMLQTVRLGLVCFSCRTLVGVHTKAVVKIHFRFNRKAAGLVGIDSIQFTR
ncbi:exported protein of unknown function [Nitrospira tepida]|uniref:Secreted protein n=1 Tax=Nitrospira tepida TaxID=2973512 RepID=A0AA86T820_9BACT|nr:hypothetical protein [Nitrospira tepida]CAI4033332.1 exported protein of unknown function [Nitrospira tepida]